ncbi:MAG: acyl-[acyl-carrier-protein]--UDP-N-acetylglucosamine O-acyltransferase, partial [Caulobacteraceae bacterium]|nr:acyl-[acyl-carrier-protein]--UDP-N-acetylglucosamine O-acyltransferase [Caulobacteraceae bacterium]
MTRLHPTAIIDRKAELAADVEIGPYCVVGPDVSLGPEVRVLSHVVIEGHTRVGEGCVIHPFASLGAPPQHSGYRGEATRLVIGARNIIREHVTM